MNASDHRMAMWAGLVLRTGRLEIPSYDHYLTCHVTYGHVEIHGILSRIVPIHSCFIMVRTLC